MKMIYVNRLVAWCQKHRTNLLVLLFFLILACIYWYPLPLYFRSRQTELELVDTAFNQWILGWGHHALTHYPWRFFEANMFYPFAHTLAWGDHLFSLVLLSLPLIPLFGVLGAYNLILIGSTALAAFTMYLFVHYLTKQRAAAILAGVMWGYMTYRIDERGHIQVQVLQWIPLVFLFAEKIRQEFHRRNWLLFVGFGFLAFATNFYLTMYLLIGFGVFCLVMLLCGRLNKKTVWRLALGTGLALTLALPLYIPSILIQLKDPIIRDNSSQISMALHGLLPWPWPGTLIRSIFEAANHPITKPPTNHSLGLLTYLFLPFAVWRFIAERKKWKDNLVYVAFIIVAFVCLAMALGPIVWLHGKAILNDNPFFTLPYKYIPGYTAIRMPMRAFLIGSLATMVVAAWGIAPLLRRLALRWQIITILLASVWIIIEQAPTTMVTYPTYKLADYPVYSWLRDQPGEFPIYEYPAFPGLGGGHANDVVEGRRMYFSTVHWKRRISGSISPYRPKSYGENMQLLNMLGDDPSALALLRQWKVRYVVFMPDDFKVFARGEDDRQEVKARLDAMPELKKEVEFPNATVYQIR